MLKNSFKIFLFISILLCAFINIISPVSATIYFKGFEGGTVGQQYGDTEFYTVRDYNEPPAGDYQACYVYDNNPFHGTRDYYIFFEDYFYSRFNLCSFYYNYSMSTYMTSFKMYIRQYADCSNEWTRYHFKNNAGTDIIYIRISLGNPLSHYQYADFDGTWIECGMMYTLSGYDYFGWDILDNDTIRYYTYYNVSIDTPRNIVSDMRINRTKIDTDETASGYKFLIDDIYYTTGQITGMPPQEGEQQNYTFYFRFRDITTGNVIHWKGKEVPINFMGSADYTNCYMTSSYFTTGYGNDEYYPYNDYIPISFNFTDGSFIEFIFSNSFTLQNFTCNIGIYDIYFKAFSKTIQIYSGSSHDIWLEPTSYIDGVNYAYCGGNDRTNGQISICLTDSEYDFGESLRMQYYLPTGNWLLENGWKTYGWWFAIFDTSEYFGWRWTDWDYIYRYEIPADNFDADRHTLEIPIGAYNWHGFHQYYEKYELCIVNFVDQFRGKGVVMFDNLFFYCSGADFMPNGTIETISPNPAYLGQEVTISFLSNGIGRLEINYPNGDRYFSTEYLYSDSIHTIPKTMSGVGSFSIELYTYGELGQNTSVPVDVDSLVINPLGSNGTYGSYGYGVPYLYIPLYRVIAGFDTLQIYYRSYKNDSRLNITSPRSEMSYFSTTISNESDNVLSISIPNYMMIGTWNVTLIGGDIYGNNETLYTSFNVVNEEGNWIEFTKHVYTTMDSFAVYIKHSYRVSLTLYKNDVAQGESIILNLGEHDNELYVIPTEIIVPEIGNWRIEMWRINDRNVVYELAEWECIVIYQSPVTEPSDITFDIIGFINVFIPDDLQFVIGLVIIVLCFVAVAMLSKNLEIDNMPFGVYLIVGIIGFVIDIKLELFDFWMIVIFVFIFSVLVVWYILGQFGILSQPMGKSTERTRTIRATKSGQEKLTKFERVKEKKD